MKERESQIFMFNSSIQRLREFMYVRCILYIPRVIEEAYKVLSLKLYGDYAFMCFDALDLCVIENCIKTRV